MHFRSAQWLAIAVICLAMMEPCQGADVEVGLIESFNAPPDHYSLIREPERTIVAVQPGGRLMRGDRIEVKFDGDWITIWLFEPSVGKKSAIVLSRSSGIYLVDGQVPERGISQRFLGIWQWAAQELGLQETEQREDTLTEASVRDIGGFAVPLLAGAQFLSEGRRPLRLAWPSNPGAARIEVVGPTGEVMASGDSQSDTWTSTSIDLAPGTYAISVRPKSGPGTDTTLKVVPATALPTFPQDPTAAELPAELVDTLRATWLAARGARFALESYQIVAPIADRYHPAELLKRALIEGRLPRRRF